MSALVAIAYPDEGTARRARDNLAKGVDQGLVEVEDVAIIFADDDGRVLPIFEGWYVGTAAFAGGVAGGLIGLAFLGPLLGMAVGAAAAGRAAWNTTHEETDIAASFLAELWESLTPGTAALVILLRDVDVARVLPHIQEPGRVIHAELGDKLRAQLDTALKAARRESSA
jgi:uncharacterized membrane protein